MGSKRRVLGLETYVGTANFAKNITALLYFAVKACLVRIADEGQCCSVKEKCGQGRPQDSLVSNPATKACRDPGAGDRPYILPNRVASL